MRVKNVQGGSRTGGRESNLCPQVEGAKGGRVIQQLQQASSKASVDGRCSVPLRQSGLPHFVRPGGLLEMVAVVYI
jgi:hypothetical protein